MCHTHKRVMSQSVCGLHVNRWHWQRLGSASHRRHGCGTHSKVPYVSAKEPRVFAKEPRVFAKEPCMSQKSPIHPSLTGTMMVVHTQKSPALYSKETYTWIYHERHGCGTQSKVRYVSAKEAYMSANESYVCAKEPRARLFFKIQKCATTWEWVTLQIWISHDSHKNWSLHTWEWIMAHIRMSHVTHKDISCVKLSPRRDIQTKFSKV
jgi:hypothetical protein